MAMQVPETYPLEASAATYGEPIMRAPEKPPVPKVRHRKLVGGRTGNQAIAGWLFVLPMIVIIGMFLLIPVGMAAWVSVSNWNGNGSPFGADFVGVANYQRLLTGTGLATRNLGTALRNNLYYVLLVVPLQTIISLALAILVNQKVLKAKGMFRTAYYFPSVTSSVAITVIFMFLFSASGAVNRALAVLGGSGPNWLADPRGFIHIILGWFGVTSPPAALQASPLLAVAWWDWLAGPSVAMWVFIFMAIFTTSGTFMLLFLAALQQIDGEVEEAAMVDGATGWQKIRHVTVPMLRPTIFTVITLGLIGTWQVFDQIFTGTQGGPQSTTMTPAFLSYQTSFIDTQWGNGAAIAFILFFIIVVMTLLQRFILRDRQKVPRRKQFSYLRAQDRRAAGPVAGSAADPVVSGVSR